LTASSLGAGLATTSTGLLVARAIQGAGAALIAPAALSLVMTLFAGVPAELGKALGFWGASAAAGGTAGVFLGGVFTEWLSWRWTFLVNVPVSLAVLAAAVALLPRGSRQRGSVDVAGAAAVTAALALGVYTVVTINDPGVTAGRNVALVVVSAALFGLFVLIQRLRRAPLVPLAIFRAPNLTVGNLVMALLGAAWIPMWFFLNMYLQQILGYGAFASGLALLPMTLAIMALMMTTTVRVIGKLGPKRTLVTGLVLLGVALVLFARLPMGGTFMVDVLLPSLLAALGMSLAYIPAMITATSGAAREQEGLASGVVNTTYQVGSAIGLAAMVALAGARSAGLAAEGISGPATLHGGFSVAFVGAAIIAFVAAAIAAWRVRSAAPGVAAEAQPSTEARAA
jgi:predicted MFS family arabinose efflux permease